VTWVASRLGASLTETPCGPALLPGAVTVELALRINPARPHLLVSRLLGKHIPVAVDGVLAAGALLGGLARIACDGESPIVVGFAETATALGHSVAAVAAGDGAAAAYLHTTRRASPAGATVVRFREEHSHATEQSLATIDDRVLRDGRPLILVDDEQTTGRTALNAITSLHQRWPRERYVLASLLDTRSDEQRATLTDAVRELGAQLTSVSLIDGVLSAPEGFAADAAALVRGRSLPIDSPVGPAAPVHRWTLTLDAPVHAATGWTPADEAALGMASALAASLPVAPDPRTLVLGDEEFLYVPQRLAAAIGPQVRTSSTTRSPVLVIDEAGYPIRTALRIRSTEDAERPTFAYNVAASIDLDSGNAPGFDDVVLVTDAGFAQVVASGLLDALRHAARQTVHVVSVERAPGPASLRRGCV
jgi:hypothetical protein